MRDPLSREIPNAIEIQGITQHDEKWKIKPYRTANLIVVDCGQAGQAPFPVFHSRRELNQLNYWMTVEPMCQLELLELAHFENYSIL